MRYVWAASTYSWVFNCLMNTVSLGNCPQSLAVSRSAVSLALFFAIITDTFTKYVDYLFFSLVLAFFTTPLIRILSHLFIFLIQDCLQIHFYLRLILDESVTGHETRKKVIMILKRFWFSLHRVATLIFYIIWRSWTFSQEIIKTCGKYYELSRDEIQHK